MHSLQANSKSRKAFSASTLPNIMMEVLTSLLLQLDACTVIKLEILRRTMSSLGRLFL